MTGASDDTCSGVLLTAHGKSTQMFRGLPDKGWGGAGQVVVWRRFGNWTGAGSGREETPIPWLLLGQASPAFQEVTGMQSPRAPASSPGAHWSHHPPTWGSHCPQCEAQSPMWPFASSSFACCHLLTPSPSSVLPLGHPHAVPLLGLLPPTCPNLSHSALPGRSQWDCYFLGKVFCDPNLAVCRTMNSQGWQPLHSLL